MGKTMTSTDFNAKLATIKEEAIGVIRNLLKEKMTTDSINLMYYEQEYECKYGFLDFDGDGYGRGIFISQIVREGDDYIFYMVDEDGDGWGERNLDDFTSKEVVWILEMLENAFNNIEWYCNGIILDGDAYDYEYDEKGEVVGVMK